jgi:protein ImuB
LPHLAIERWKKSTDSPPDAPIVLTLEGAHGPVIHRVTNAAARRGARAGARLTDARALDPALVAVPADLDGDAALMQRLARWAGRWSPLVEIDGEGLGLDVTGVAHLFKGERELVDDIHRRFERIGLTARVAIAPTARAAWAFSHFARQASIVIPATAGACVHARYSPSSSVMDAGCWHDELVPLHVSALRLDPDTVRTLERLGLKTIGALMNIPRLALARRFRGAEDVIDALDRMVGRKPEALTAVSDDRPPRAAFRLEEPAMDPEAAARALERLILDLVSQLQERHLGARRLSLIGFRVDGSCAVASVATAIPSREPKHLQRLLADKAAGLDPQFGFDAFALNADWTEDLQVAQESLVEEPSGERELARLVDRLAVKLGPGRVRRPKRQESHLPERASGWVSALAGAEPIETSIMRRPERLLDRPEAIDVIYATPQGMPRRFVWRRKVHDIARAEGPERIAPEWWWQLSSTRLRDYYRVEDSDGRRYWIYREGVAGDGRGGPPNWFIHGLFG